MSDVKRRGCVVVHVMGSAPYLAGLCIRCIAVSMGSAPRLCSPCIAVSIGSAPYPRIKHGGCVVMPVMGSAPYLGCRAW
jgi:hypothetical protein